MQEADSLVGDGCSPLLACGSKVFDSTYAVQLTTPFSLRQHGTSYFICVSFCAHRAQKRNTKEDIVALCRRQNADGVCSVFLSLYGCYIALAGRK
jgi:hypothetical protein